MLLLEPILKDDDMKRITLISSILILALMQGCTEQQTSQIKTQAMGEVALKADVYELHISFKGVAASSPDAMLALEQAQADFMLWEKESGFEVAHVHLDLARRPRVVEISSGDK